MRGKFLTPGEMSTLRENSRPATLVEALLFVKVATSCFAPVRTFVIGIPMLGNLIGTDPVTNENIVVKDAPEFPIDLVADELKPEFKKFWRYAAPRFEFVSRGVAVTNLETGEVKKYAPEDVLEAVNLKPYAGIDESS